VTGSRISVVVSAFAGAGRGDRGATVAQRNPHVRVALRLALHEPVAGLIPRHDAFGLVVEDELALVGLHRQDRVAFLSRTTVISSASRGQPASINILRFSST
jgi:hypothetical protein